jgi:hypothetical protein
MRSKKLVLLHLLLVLSISLLSACTSGSSIAGPSGKSSTPFEYTYDETHALPASRKVRVTSEDAKVVVSGSDRNDVRIQADYKISSTARMLQSFTYKLNVHSDGAELRVDEMRKTGSRNFVYDKRAHLIRIEVPRNAHVTIEEEDGSCTLTSIGGSVDVSMDDGSVHATDCAGAITVAIDEGTFTHHNCTGSVRVQRR